MTRMSRLAGRILAALIPVALGVAGAGAFPASAGVRPLTSVSDVTAAISPPSMAASALTTYTVTALLAIVAALVPEGSVTVIVSLPDSAPDAEVLNVTV